MDGSRKLGRPPDKAKHEAMIAAAATSFFQHGYAATALEHVAAQAGVSKVTLYNHFGDKSGLFTAAVEHECEKMRGYFSIAPDERDLRARLTAIGEGMVAFLSRPEMVQFERRIAAETERDASLGQAFLTAGPHRMRAAFASFLAHAHAAGELCVPDPVLAAEQFASMCKGFGDLELRFGAPQDHVASTERIAAAVDIMLQVYAAK